MRKSTDIVNDINTFEPSDGNWLGLQALLDELWQTGDQENYTKDLLKVFERFPEEDGAGVLWSIIHGVENFKEYEGELLDSLNRQLSDMGLTMLIRIKNTGAKTVGGIQISKIVNKLLDNGQINPTFKELLTKIGE